MRSGIAVLALVAIAWADPDFTAVDHKALQHLTKTRETPKIIFHYAPDLPGASVKKAVQLNLGFHRGLEKTMRMRYDGRIHVFLYATAEQMRTITGSSAAAFSNGTRSIHQPHDYDDAHEMVHIFALQIPKETLSLPPDGFFVEGLATALQKEDAGIAIDDYAAVYAQAGRLPRLYELRREWMRMSMPGVHTYHVAGSLIGFLIETFGIEKVKVLYGNCLECEGVLGVSFVRLERDWWDWLAKRDVPARHRDEVLKRLGYSAEHRMPNALANAKGTALFDGKSTTGWVLEHPKSWRVENGLLLGSCDSAWHRIHTKRSIPANAAVRVRIRLVEGNALQVRLNRDATRANEAIFAAWSSFIVRAGPGGGVLANRAYRIRPGVWIDLVVVSRDGRFSAYVDGLRVLDAINAATNAGSVSLCVERGSVEVREVTLLDAR